MILFLDDDKYRTKWFRSQVPVAHTAETSDEMIALLGKHTPVDVLYLDHDLGGKSMISEKDGDTGMRVVKWMGEHRPVVGKVVIHSLNPWGVLNMESYLTQCGYDVYIMPFTQMLVNGVPYA